MEATMNTITIETLAESGLAESGWDIEGQVCVRTVRGQRLPGRMHDRYVAEVEATPGVAAVPGVGYQWAYVVWVDDVSDLVARLSDRAGATKVSDAARALVDAVQP